MDESRSSSLVAKVQVLILATFDVSAQEAQEEACGLVTLAEDWNGCGAEWHNWDYIVKKSLGAALRWRSTGGLQEFCSMQENIEISHELYMKQHEVNNFKQLEKLLEP